MFSQTRSLYHSQPAYLRWRVDHDKKRTAIGLRFGSSSRATTAPFPVDAFNQVLVRVWNLDVGTYQFKSERERSLALTFKALSKRWAQLDIAILQNGPEFAQLARTTVSEACISVYRGDDRHRVPIPLDFKKHFSIVLRDSTLIQVGEKGKRENMPAASEECNDIVQRFAGILEKIGMNILCDTGEENDGDEEAEEIQKQFNKVIGQDIDAFESNLQDMAPVASM
ncbi:hypothetical protein C8R43DRAFT_1139613 [Mycena crocata]|nr:hypothetical protein C8R43DRAFT_1139613 [Mycena crocata]